MRILTTLRLNLAIAILASNGFCQADSDTPDCRESADAKLWTSPAIPVPGEPFKVMAVTTEGPADTLVIRDKTGGTTPVHVTRRGGPPWSLEGEVDSLLSFGPVQIEARRDGETVGCRTLNAAAPPPRWDKATEAFYSAWIETLFDAPPSENVNFKSLEPVLRDPDRNFLHNHLGQHEDTHLPATPDCADLPYFLRTYFAWKIGLPVAFRACDRGTANHPPRCGPATIDERLTRGRASASSFTGLMRQIADTVHSGSARTALDDESTDFYPVPPERKDLWPGTLYADPYGHVLIIAKWFPQSGSGPGTLMAVDAQPDNSVARKRFWEGNFLFANTAGAGPGFKTFRPLIQEDGRTRLPSNHWLAINAPVAPYSDQQDGMDPDDFFAVLGKEINPLGLAPEQAYDAMLDALVEQIETRIGALDNGENYLRQRRGTVIPMPSGAAIYETIGAWEDYATPSRDMRLLIALKVIAGLPKQITRYPALFSLAGRTPEEASQDIQRRHEQSIGQRRITYTRSDGSPWELTVADVFARREALQIGYNPNDCVESRWGALPDSDEYATCIRHAPQDQKSKMAQYRSWFEKTQRPTR
jgi:hypothetical protein